MNPLILCARETKKREREGGGGGEKERQKKMSTRGKQKREKLHGRQRGTDRFHRWPRRSRLRRRSTYKSARVFPSYQHCKLKMR